MATYNGSVNTAPLGPLRIQQLANDLMKCVKKDQLVKAKFHMKGLRREDKQKIVAIVIDGNTPLFVASQQGLVYFVNYILEECGGDIEQRGIYEVQEDRTKHQVTPLWCAAVANKLDVVKLLIKHNADVNATSDTQSTPVRSACFMTNTEVVKYLVENGADIHKPNINGGTCLINSVQSVDLCRYLIEKNADPNAEDNSGNIALHYAIREGRMETVKLLLKHGSDPYKVNDFGDDAIQTASLRGYVDIVEYLVSKVKPPLHRQIEAYELLGTNYVDEKHDIQRALQIWKHGIELKQRATQLGLEYPVNKRSKQVKPNAAYQNAVEASSTEEFEKTSSENDAVYMQSLLIRERILGPDHKDTIFGLMYRGAVYADTHRYQRCVDLWKYAFQLRHEKNEPLNHECLFTLQALCKLFWEIFEEHTAGYTNEAVQYDDVLQVLEMASKEVEAAKDLIHIRPVHIHQQEEFHLLMLLLLHLIHLLTKLPKTEEQEVQFKRRVHKAVGLHAQGLSGKSLLHLALDNKSSKVSEEFYSHFPDVEVVNVLLECGENINGCDNDQNMPLHVCAQALKGLSGGADEKKFEAIVKLLLKNGAHVDSKNAAGKLAGEELAAATSYKICLGNYMTLRCLAARTIKKLNIPYEGEVPQSLMPFIRMH